MKYNKENIDVNKGFTLFYGHSIDSPYPFFSQFTRLPFTYNGIQFVTAEHYMMFSKAILFLDEEIAKEILKDPSPYRAKKLGKKVSNFDLKVWEEKRYDIVLHGNILKFSQNQRAKEVLLSTEDTIIVECSPSDKIWGIGIDRFKIEARQPDKWNGLNLLGFALMEVRDILRNYKDDTTT